jgi:hypothetical protein
MQMVAVLVVLAVVEGRCSDEVGVEGGVAREGGGGGAGGGRARWRRGFKRGRCK